MKKLLLSVLCLCSCVLICVGCQTAPNNQSAPLASSAPMPAATPVPKPTEIVPAEAPLAEYTGKIEPQDACRAYYEIFVGSFYDSNGDGVGDIRGVTKKLDYINDCRAESNSSLHASGIWLMPIMPSPTYHKYDTVDYYSIDPDYGTMEDFQALLDECAERGIALIMDLTVNHTSNQHPWFLSACESMRAGECSASVDEPCEFALPCKKHNKYCAYYNFSDSVKSGYHPVVNASGLYFEGQFWEGMPDLNLDEPLVREEILSICRFWLDKGVSGFRLDAVTSYYTGNAGLNAEFLKWLTAELSAYKSDVYLVGEAWTDEGSILNLYQSSIPSLFNFPFAQSNGEIVEAVRSGDGAKLANKVQAWQEKLKSTSPNSIDAPFLSNHDMTRSAGMLLRDHVKIKKAAAVYLLLPGNPFIYYGEEIGMTGGSDNDPNKRAPMQWAADGGAGFTAYPEGTTKKEPPETGVYEQLTDGGSILRFYIDAIKIRNAEPALARGTITAIDTGEKGVMAYKTEYEGNTLYVLHNLGDTNVRLPLELFNNTSPLHALSAGSAIANIVDGQIALPASTTLILG